MGESGPTSLLRQYAVPRRLPLPVLRVLMHVASRWAFSPRADWPARRRRTDLAVSLLPLPRGIRRRSLRLGGVPAEELIPADARDDARLVYFHGGGYAIGSSRSHRPLAALMAVGFGAPVLTVDYRLAPEHPHPAALEDAVSVWSALTDEHGLASGRIAIAGDSAGGGLALALTQRLLAGGEPLPAAVGLISPWLDLATDAAGRRPAAARDVVLTRGLLRAFAQAYVAGAAAEDPALSPLFGRFEGLPPLVVHTTGEELIRADGERLVARARTAGVAVSHEQLAGLWHDVHITAAVMAEPTLGAPLRMAAALRAHLAI